jgi:adenosylmethionine-8-amino-7-oxononanoate aminotransferase
LSEMLEAMATKESLTREESEKILRGFLNGALYEQGLYCRADDRGDPVIQLAPPLTCGPKEFEEIEQILRSVLIEAGKRL